MTTISTCPFLFCGSDENDVWSTDHPDPGASTVTTWYFVHCNKCQADGPVDLGESGAIAAWNGAGGWISVEDDMPNLDRRVRAYLPDASLKITDVVWNAHIAKFVTHWQPLPPPPKRKHDRLLPLPQ